MEEMMDIREELKDDLARRIKGSRSKAQWASIGWYSLNSLSIICGAAASISVLSDLLTKEIIAILAALPAVSTSITILFNFNKLNDWWTKKANKLDNLIIELREEEDPTVINKKMRKYLEAHNKDWPSLGSPPTG
jgi:hypothetical protein